MHRKVPTGAPAGEWSDATEVTYHTDSSLEDSRNGDAVSSDNLTTDVYNSQENIDQATPATEPQAHELTECNEEDDDLEDSRYAEKSDEVPASGDAPEQASLTKRSIDENSQQAEKIQSRPTRLTHLTHAGEAHMVDISNKEITVRSATATSTLFFGNDTTFEAMQQATTEKGDVLAVARVAGIQAAKKTADLIPLAHPGLNLTRVTIDIRLFPPADHNRGRLTVIARADCVSRTGVGMEAITAATVASLTLYDMLKEVDKAMYIGSVRVVAKSGGKSGDWVYNRGAKQIQKIKRSPSWPSAAHGRQLPDLSGLSSSSDDVTKEQIRIDHAKLKQREARLEIERGKLELEHEKVRWREDRLRHERGKLEYLTEKLKVDHKRVSLSSMDIGAEIRKAEQRISGLDLESSSDSPSSSPSELTTTRLRDLTSGEWADRTDAADFQQKRTERYAQWVKEH